MFFSHFDIVISWLFLYMAYYGMSYHWYDGIVSLNSISVTTRFKVCLINTVYIKCVYGPWILDGSFQNEQILWSK